MTGLPPKLGDKQAIEIVSSEKINFRKVDLDLIYEHVANVTLIVKELAMLKFAIDR